MNETEVIINACRYSMLFNNVSFSEDRTHSANLENLLYKRKYHSRVGGQILLCASVVELIFHVRFESAQT